MFALTLSKLELFFEIARKFHRHCTKTNYDIMADYCLKEIAASYEIEYRSRCYLPENSPTTRQFRPPTFLFQSHSVFNCNYRGNEFLYMSRSL